MSASMVSDFQEFYENIAERALRKLYPQAKIIHKGRGYAGGGSDFTVFLPEKVIPVEVKGLKLLRKNGNGKRLGKVKIWRKDLENWVGNTGVLLVVTDLGSFAPGFFIHEIPIERLHHENRDSEWYRLKPYELEELAERILWIPQEEVSKE